MRYDLRTSTSRSDRCAFIRENNMVDFYAFWDWCDEHNDEWSRLLDDSCVYAISDYMKSFRAAALAMPSDQLDAMRAARDNGLDGAGCHTETRREPYEMKVKKTYRIEEETIFDLQKVPAIQPAKRQPRLSRVPYASPYASHTARAAQSAPVTGGRRRWPRFRNSSR